MHGGTISMDCMDCKDKSWLQINRFLVCGSRAKAPSD